MQVIKIASGLGLLYLALVLFLFGVLDVPFGVAALLVSGVMLCLVIATAGLMLIIEALA